MFDSALDLLVVPLQFLLRFWSFDIFRMFWMVLFWIFILSLIDVYKRQGPPRPRFLRGATENCKKGSEDES